MSETYPNGPADIEMTYSPDDGGWYATVFTAADAETFVTSVYKGELVAMRKALMWCNLHGYRHRRIIDG